MCLWPIGTLNVLYMQYYYPVRAHFTPVSMRKQPNPKQVYWRYVQVGQP